MRLYHSTQRGFTAGWSCHARSLRVHSRRVVTSPSPGSYCQILSWLLTSTETFTESCYSATEGILPRKKPELECVLENKKREQNKQRELAVCAPSDLEVKLRTRRQRIQVYELEEKKKRESLQNVPEFIRVRGTLKRAQTVSW